jgi:hypothetical protein
MKSIIWSTLCQLRHIFSSLSHPNSYFVILQLRLAWWLSEMLAAVPFSVACFMSYDTCWHFCATWIIFTIYSTVCCSGLTDSYLFIFSRYFITFFMFLAWAATAFYLFWIFVEYIAFSWFRRICFPLWIPTAELLMSVWMSLLLLIQTVTRSVLNDKYSWNMKWAGPPLWSSGQSSWLQIQWSWVRFPTLPDFLNSRCGTLSAQPLE